MDLEPMNLRARMFKEDFLGWLLFAPILGWTIGLLVLVVTHSIYISNYFNADVQGVVDYNFYQQIQRYRDVQS